ncbi:TadA family conjugal transfer-associated ATPase [Luteipulveratus sp. YIM 133132]|uniref:TadA family conjugal transfer-associated ATPase n=1 Tax=Luteipulveratus flavus TaxID=3031728 RepID=UPI0023B01C7B|nr:TadA family conjugal transfer-associated ATPase [Luteipulveratus sp. YIM 133132]MDE9366951.1 TadA family conjugal transfer-associated ATPase [Luteipulveratus sp. YIM 133132]
MTVGDTIWKHIRDGQAPTPGNVAALARHDAAVLGADRAKELRERLSADVLGAGPLEDLLAEPGVTDVLVNGTAGVWIDRGSGLHRSQVEVGDAETVRRLAVRLAGVAGRRLDETSPYVDGLLPGGVRLHAVLPPLVDGAAHISLRIPQRDRPDLEALHRWGAVDDVGVAALRRLVRARQAFVISGGTGSGKTTLLGALLREVEADERIVLVEDVRELQVAHPHVVRLEARAPNVEGRGEVGLSTLVRQCLRMRPDRLVVGEVRGAEVRELLSALNTGHEGGCGTVHANASSDVVARFEALGALAGMSPQAVRTQLASAISVVVHLRRAAGLRQVSEIGVLTRDDGRVEVTPGLVRRGAGLVPGPAWDVLRARLALDGDPC